jgi:murein L,D-transpeptidase YafK
VHVYKRESAVELHCDGALLRTFPATFGGRPSGRKEREGDERTPEGTYTITSHVTNPRFGHFLGLSYPNPTDVARARALGIERMGFGVGIHGSAQPLLARIWIRLAHATGLAAYWGPTDGCIALTSEDIAVLADAARIDTPVAIHAHR